MLEYSGVGLGRSHVNLIRDQYHSNTNPERKRQRSGKPADDEAALTTWFNNARSRNIPLSGPILEGKAKDLAVELGNDDFNPTSGWLSRWKNRNMIVHTKLHGENAHLKDAADRLELVVLEFLPPNTTAIIQSCDQGIIRNLKGHNQSQLVQKTLTEIDTTTATAVEIAKKVTLLDAIHMATNVWKKVKTTTIVNCFRKAGFKDTHEEELIPEKRTLKIHPT
ncbi:uncharacterized protein [Mytilus edulis]|uniref:uncharacterized protein n=1 Tax=Mytilus edulis TaxID=6550 RepID=UPI0039EF3CBB